MNTSDSVIVSPARACKALSSDDLRRCAPSVFAEHARPGVSSRYTFVSTQQVVALLRAEGWEPVKASEQRVRLEDRIGFQMHEIRFARRVDLEAGAFQVGSTRAEMILQNAHDGTRAYVSHRESLDARLDFTQRWRAHARRGAVVRSWPQGPCCLHA